MIKRLEQMKKIGIQFKLIYPFFTESYSLKIVKRILRRPLFDEGTILNQYNGITIEKIGIKRTVLEAVSDRLNQSLMHRKIANGIEKVFNIDDFDLIVLHGMYSLNLAKGVYILKQKFNKPFVVFLHGSDVNIKMKKRNREYIKILQSVEKAVFVSNRLLEMAKSYGYDGKNAVVIPNGYDSRVFYPVDKVKIRKELGLYEENKRYVGYVGNLVYIKRADKLREIFSKIASKVPNTKFIIVGDGPLRNEVEKVKDIDMTITGFISQQEVAKYMNAMDVMILPSRNEGWGCVALEAQACGTCVIGSNNGGIPEAVGFSEYVIEDGVDFEKRIAERVVEVLKNGYDKEKLIDRAKNYTWENTVSREIELFEELAKR